MAEYDAWAAFYDIIHRGLPGEAEFYIEQAQRIGGHILEVGCGTGRITIPMAVLGLNIVGIDNSHAMLKRCQTNYNDAIAEGARSAMPLLIVQADMRCFALSRRFDLIVMPYRTFMHCPTPDEQRACLAALRAHLAPNGLLMLNLWAARPTAIAPHTGPTSGVMRLAGQYDFPDDEGGLLHFYTTRYDEYTQELDETHLMVFTDPDGATRLTQVLPMRRGWLTRREMEHLARAEGFEVEALFGDFDCGPFTESSSEMIWVLRAAR